MKYKTTGYSQATSAHVAKRPSVLGEYHGLGSGGSGMSPLWVQGCNIIWDDGKVREVSNEPRLSLGEASAPIGWVNKGSVPDLMAVGGRKGL